MAKFRTIKTMKSSKRRTRIQSRIKKGRSFEEIKDMSRIRGKKIMKSKRRTRSKSMMIKKARTFEGLKANTMVLSQSMEIDDVLATEDSWMLLEILSRLPVKSLLRFMCISKQWKTLISSHYFRKLHREKHASSPPLLIASHNTYDIEEPPYDPHLHINTYLITSDLEGKLVERITVPIPSGPFAMRPPPYQSKLLCFSNFISKKFYFYNPSTRRSFLLTNPSCFSSPKFQRHYSTDYGYIPSKDEYIMVHLVKLSNGKLCCEVLENISISKDDNFKLHYSSKWRSSIDQATTRLHCVAGYGIFVGGIFYWQALSEKDKELFILSFDVEKKCFSTLGYPRELSDSDDDDATVLLELKGDLFLASFPESPAVLVLWKLSSNNKRWTRYWKFDCERLFGFRRGDRHNSRYFRWEIFLYALKYHKGYDQQPLDHQVSAEMGELHLADGIDGMPIWNVAAVHTNLFTL